jgi:iron complex transport system ATP-binding protein
MAREIELAALSGRVGGAGDGGVTIDGMALEDGARVRARSLGYLAQTGDVAWDMDVATLVGLGRLPWGGGGGAAVQAAMAAMDLGDLAGRRISTLSGGERARAMLARVLAGNRTGFWPMSPWRIWICVMRWP